MIILFEMIFVIILGCILHFTYEWSHHNKIIGWLSAVNESTWEHVKLVILPTFLTIIFDYWFLGSNPNYWFAKFIQMLFAVVMLPVISYLAEMIFKKHNLTIYIMIFCLVVVYALLGFDWILRVNGLGMEVLGVIGCIMTMVAFSVLTFFPVKNSLFIDPRSKKIGFDAHECHHAYSRGHKK